MDALAGTLPSAVFLGILAAIALYPALTRGWAGHSTRHARRAVAIAGLTVVFQSLHFAEELATGFAERFPALFGLEAIPAPLFVGFNLVWISIWCLSAAGLQSRRRAALFPLWFLGIAGVANGVGHPLFSLATGGYFPGLWTSPVVGVAGFVLLRRLARVTRARDAGTGREESSAGRI